MNRTLTKALLTTALLTSGIVGAGSVIAQAGDDAASTDVEVSQTADATETGADATDTGVASGLQTVDEPVEPAAQDAQGTDDAERGRGCGNGEAVAEALGLTADEVGAARAAGSTIADLAAAQGVDADVVIQALVDAKAERLDEKVAAGELTAEEAAQRLANAEQRATDRVNGAANGDNAG